VHKQCIRHTNKCKFALPVNCVFYVGIYHIRIYYIYGYLLFYVKTGFYVNNPGIYIFTLGTKVNTFYL